MGNTTGTTGAQLREERGHIKAAALGRAMGYGGKSPHSRVLQLEREAAPSDDMVARYRAALATLKEGAR